MHSLIINVSYLGFLWLSLLGWLFPALILIDIYYCPFNNLLTGQNLANLAYLSKKNNLLTGIFYPILFSCAEYALCCLLEFEFLMTAVFDLQVSNEWPKVVGFTIQQPFEWNSCG